MANSGSGFVVLFKYQCYWDFLFPDHKSSFFNQISPILVNEKFRVGFCYFVQISMLLGFSISRPEITIFPVKLIQSWENTISGSGSHRDFLFPDPRSSFSNRRNPMLVNGKFQVGFCHFFPNFNVIGIFYFPTLNHHFPSQINPILGKYYFRCSRLF